MRVQQDAQELLAFLLDALHEDLNRVFLLDSQRKAPLRARLLSRAVTFEAADNASGPTATAARSPSKALTVAVNGSELTPPPPFSSSFSAQRRRVRTPRGGDVSEAARALRTWQNHLVRVRGSEGWGAAAVLSL